MIPDRETALDELAVAIAEATVDAWLADVIAEQQSVVDATTDVDNYDYQKNKTPNRRANSAE